MRFPSWTVSPHPVVPVPLSGPGPSVHLLDHDPVVQRPAKRFRITGKSSVHKRELCSGDGLPMPKRWKRLVPPGTGLSRIEDGVPPFLFPRTGLVDELAWHPRSVAAGSGAFCSQPRLIRCT